MVYAAFMTIPVSFSLLAPLGKSRNGVARCAIAGGVQGLDACRDRDVDVLDASSAALRWAQSLEALLQKVVQGCLRPHERFVVVVVKLLDFGHFVAVKSSRVD